MNCLYIRVGQKFEKCPPLGPADGFYNTVLRRYLCYIHLPTTTICDQGLVTDMIESYKDKESQCQEKKKKLTEQRFENDEHVKNF